MNGWHREVYGDPCHECGFEWSMSQPAALELAEEIADRYAAALEGRDGTEQHPDLAWSAGAYVSHVVDNFRIWAERLAAAGLGSTSSMVPYDGDALSRARRYDRLPLAGALWSLRRAVDDWHAAVAMANRANASLLHPDRREQTVEEVVRGNVHDAQHHLRDVQRCLAAGPVGVIGEARVGEPETVEICVVDYEPAWVTRFEAEASRIRGALGDGALMVEHIGSTSVPGLAAKPIIDICVVVTDSSDESSYVPALEAVGYELRVREPDWHEHRMLRTPAHDVHVHVFSRGSTEIGRHLAFRDRLRVDSEDRALYEATKRALATQGWPTMQHYADAKADVIEGILTRAGPDRHA